MQCELLSLDLIYFWNSAGALVHRLRPNEAVIRQDDVAPPVTPQTLPHFVFFFKHSYISLHIHTCEPPSFYLFFIRCRYQTGTIVWPSVNNFHSLWLQYPLLPWTTQSPHQSYSGQHHGQSCTTEGQKKAMNLPSPWALPHSETCKRGKKIWGHIFLGTTITTPILKEMFSTVSKDEKGQILSLSL